MPDTHPPQDIDAEPPAIQPRAKTAAGFVGPAASGPIEHAHAVTSLAEFAQMYGGLSPMPSPEGGSATPFLAHAVRAYFAEGGARVYVVRTRDAGAASPAAYEAALRAMAEVADVSTVAAPGSSCTAAGAQADMSRAAAVAGLLVRHAEQTRDRIALLDSVSGVDPAGVRAQRDGTRSAYAALYYPWLHTSDPVTGSGVLLPPSGFVAGVYARVDAQRGVWAAPADEAVRLADGVERVIDGAESDALSRAGINTLRQSNDRGVVLWGARTTTDDPDWLYVSIRRYATFLEESIEQGLQWALFEPNGDALWTRTRGTVERFLSAQWRAGALMGNTSQQAYFVRCDRSTMTQEDLNEGRLICTIGVALVRPAEFVVLRIGAWTADHQRPCP